MAGTWDWERGRCPAGDGAAGTAIHRPELQVEAWLGGTGKAGARVPGGGAWRVSRLDHIPALPERSWLLQFLIQTQTSRSMTRPLKASAHTAIQLLLEGSPPPYFHTNGYQHSSCSKYFIRF